MPSRPKSIYMQGQDILQRMFAAGKGTSKHKDKLLNNGKPAKNKIYADSTLKTYLQGWEHFCDYLSQISVMTRDLSELEPYVQPYIDWMVECGYSPYTIHTRLSSVCKVLDLPIGDYAKPKRERKDIKRSRNPVKSDAHFAQDRHQDLILFCLCVGPRNDKELQKIRGKDLRMLPDGGFAVYIKGKGGREREAPIVGSDEEVQAVVAMMRGAGENLVFSHVHSAADIHSYRAMYACRIYLAHARPIDEIPEKERHRCRKDMAGVVYDKVAMRITSEALGHSRLDVIASSYLWAL